MAGGLYGRAISARVGEWHANLDEVSAGSGMGLNKLKAAVIVRVAGRDEGDEGWAI